jgi:hypothetical protein
MAQKIIKIGLVSLLLIVIAGTAIAYYLYNKGPVDIESSTAVAIDASDLYGIFTMDSLAAKEKYTSRVLAVNGEIKAISFNSKQQQVIILKTRFAGAAVNCTLEEPSRQIQPADKVTIKGICSGMGEGDAELGIPGDVYLSRCYLKKNK